MMKEALGNKERDLIDATQRFLEDEKSDSHSQFRSETPTHDSNLSFLIHRTYLTFQNVKLTDNLEK
jgi:hypothetical protein